MDNDEVLICRQCKVKAQALLVSDEIESVTCPSCGVTLKGGVARKMYLNELRYMATKKAQDMLGSAFKDGKAVKYQPSRLNRPSSPFAFGSSR